MSLLTAAQENLWHSGYFTEAYKILGAHLIEKAVKFCVWAPNALKVSVVGDFNDWDSNAHKMNKHEAEGIWEIIIPEAGPSHSYKFFISAQDGSSFYKADPYARRTEKGSFQASIVQPLNEFNWNDEQWLKQRTAHHKYNRPLSIYELHFGSWKKTESGAFLNYRQIASELIPYVKKMGFTHIEILPVMEHPYLPSWGYQITNYFAPTARYGTHEDFKYFVDECHKNNIGVLLDWVPGHFPRDPHGLSFFDGTALYEHADSRRRRTDWGTINFDLDKPQVRNFLLSNAFFWCEHYHIDGFRLDAVASMLYLDYAREKNEWSANIYGGNENLGAVTFLQDFNRLLHQTYPSVLTIAEDSSAWCGVTNSTAEGGLGFDYKWNMGWMNDTLHYMQMPPKERFQHSHDITFPITYGFDEQFILPLSHDEVVHLKKSLWSKMKGNRAQKFAQLKLLFLYMIGQPGKKLLFMGAELAQKKEWSVSAELNWPLLKKKENKQVQEFLSELLHFYRNEPPLFETDTDSSGFCWSNLTQKEQGVFCFLRGFNSELLFCCNFSEKMVRCSTGNKLAKSHFHLVFDSLKNKKAPSTGSPISFPVHLHPFQGIILRRKERE